MRFTVCKRKRGAREELERLLLLLWAFHGFPPTESAFKHRLRKLSFLGKLSYSISSLKKKNTDKYIGNNVYQKIAAQEF